MAYYYSTKCHVWHRSLPPNNGCLYENGLHATNLRETDLPEYYVSGIFYDCWGYVSARDVKDIVYYPDLSSSDLYGDDVLYVSFNDRIRYTPSGRPTGYDLIVKGRTIVHFLSAVAQYSSFDISNILGMFRLKQAWIESFSPCPEEFEKLISEEVN